jgi:hypothetical protein
MDIRDAALVRRNTGPMPEDSVKRQAGRSTVLALDCRASLAMTA